MQIGRVFKHLFYLPWLVRRRFPPAVMARIESAIADSEVRHGGEIRFAVEATLDLRPLLRGQSARDRALQVFSDLRVWDTEANNGVLIYLLLADRDVEIVADRGLNGRVMPDEWEVICQGMEAMFRRGAFEAGLAYGIQAIGEQRARNFPPQPERGNELPDRSLRLG